LPLCRHSGALPVAQTYPARPVRIGLAAGGSVDIVARLIAQRLSERFGQPFVIENRPGAGGDVATEAVVMFDTVPQSIEYIREGKLRALAVTTATGSPVLPDLPSISDFVPGFEAGSWWGVGVPKDTPVEIVTSFNREINAALADPRIGARLAELGTTPLLFTAAAARPPCIGTALS
jgi:tripartite-type tricarboxylate transporter receptor subunit TctC